MASMRTTRIAALLVALAAALVFVGLPRAAEAGTSAEDLTRYAAQVQREVNDALARPDVPCGQRAGGAASQILAWVTSLRHSGVRVERVVVEARPARGAAASGVVSVGASVVGARPDGSPADMGFEVFVTLRKDAEGRLVDRVVPDADGVATHEGAPQPSGRNPSPASTSGAQPAGSLGDC